MIEYVTLVFTSMFVKYMIYLKLKEHDADLSNYFLNMRDFVSNILKMEHNGIVRKWLRLVSATRFHVRKALRWKTLALDDYYEASASENTLF